MSIAPGTRLGPYEVVSRLGAGGMGEVYRATDLRLGRQVALKVLSQRLARDAAALARFEREAKAVAALSHPGICTLHDVGRDGDVSFLVMELLEGQTLGERIADGPLPLEQVTRIGAEIGRALAAAHEKDFVHRDLKPGNVMLTRSGVKLLDFGLAKALAGSEGAEPDAATGSVEVTQEGTLLGTLPYMAPEQVEGQRADTRSDIFAFGAVLYEMATGRRAFSGPSTASLISAILTSEPPPIASLRPLSSTEARPIPGSEGASAPFWSPDGRALGFSAEGKLKRLDVDGGAPIAVCDVPPGGGVAASWGRDSILFVVSPAEADVLYRVSPAGGTAAVERKPDPAKGERRIAWPSFLPDGERYLYSVRHEDFSWRLFLGEPGRPPRELGAIASAAQYAGPGQLVFVRDGTLVGQRFDWRSGLLSGEPSAISESVGYFLSTGSAAFSASPAGTIAFQALQDVNRLVWFDRTGRELGSVGLPGRHLNVTISRDGQRVAYDRARPDTGTWDVWAWDATLGVESRLTAHPETEAMPRCLPDGAIAYSTNVKGGPPRLVRRDLATGKEQQLNPGGRAYQWAEDVSPDGATLVFSERGPSGTADLWRLTLVGDAEPQPVLETPFHEVGARFSPDGRLLAYVSTESGRPEAYVMPFRVPGEKRRISSNGARAVRWSGDGREIFLASMDGTLWSVPVRQTPGFQAAAPTLLFDPVGRPWLGFDATPDGSRFLAIVPEQVGNEQPMTVLVNWAPEGAR